jgi:glutathione S-transferase
MIEILQPLEAQLGGNKYFGGDTFGFVDVAFVPFTSWFYSYETYGNFNIQTVAPKIVEWAKRCMERESVAKTLYDPQKVYKFVCSLKKRSGIE